MARLSTLLSALAVARARGPGMLPTVMAFIFRSRAQTRAHRFSVISGTENRADEAWLPEGRQLAAARARAAECRALLADGVDPIEARRVERARRYVTSARVIMSSPSEFRSLFEISQDAGTKCIQAQCTRSVVGLELFGGDDEPPLKLETAAANIKIANANL